MVQSSQLALPYWLLVSCPELCEPCCTQDAACVSSSRSEMSSVIIPWPIFLMDFHIFYPSPPISPFLFSLFSFLSFPFCFPPCPIFSVPIFKRIFVVFLQFYNNNPFIRNYPLPLFSSSSPFFLSSPLCLPSLPFYFRLSLLLSRPTSLPIFCHFHTAMWKGWMCRMLLV